RSSDLAGPGHGSAGNVPRSGTPPDRPVSDGLAARGRQRRPAARRSSRITPPRRAGCDPCARHLVSSIKEGAYDAASSAPFPASSVATPAAAGTGAATTQQTADAGFALDTAAGHRAEGGAQGAGLA